MSTNVLHGEITARIMAFLESQNNFLVLKVHVGGGKTTNTLNTLFDMCVNWIYLAPYHTVVEENLELSRLRRFNYVHLKSRRMLCLLSFYRELAQQGINIQPICEHSCPLKDDSCPYYENKRELYDNPKSWAGVHHHIPGYLNAYMDLWSHNQRMENFYDILVIDENPINVLFDTDFANHETLHYLREVIRALNLSSKETSPVLELLTYLIDQFNGNLELDNDILYAHLQIDFDEFYKEYQAGIIEEVRLRRMDISQIPHDYISILSKIKRNMTYASLPAMIMKKQKSEYNQKKYYFMVFDNSALLKFPLKIIALDGTADVPLWESITNRTASVMERKYQYENIFQLKDGRYPLSSWVRNHKITTSGRRLCDLIDKISVKKKFNVLVVTTKPLQKYIYQNIKVRNVKFANYYYLRSRNEFYETCDTVILACEPNIPQFQIACFSQLSGWGQDIWRRIFTDEEIIQAVGRVRENVRTAPNGRTREPRQVFIFPATSLEYLHDATKQYKLLFPEANVVSYNELIMKLDKKDMNSMILDFLPMVGVMFKKELQQKLKISRTRLNHLIDDLIMEGEIEEWGKGVRRQLKSI